MERVKQSSVSVTTRGLSKNRNPETWPTKIIGIINTAGYVMGMMDEPNCVNIGKR